MNSEFILSQGAGQKLEFAIRRNDGTTEDVDYLSAGENFRAVTLLRTGKAKLVPCNPYLQKIADGVLGATTGQRTLAKAKNLFPGGLDPDFVNWGTDVAGAATEEAPFEVFEMTKNGTFEQILDGFGVDRKKLCWEQDQIITFVENHKDLLHPDGWETFFLFSVKFEEGTEDEREKFFVAYVRRDDGGQHEARVYCLSHDYVWHAEYRHRFVIPQLIL